MTGANPELMDNFDQDAIVRDTREIFGYPEKYLRDERKVRRLRAEKAEAAVAAAETLAAVAGGQKGGDSGSGKGKTGLAGGRAS
jgi:hypothetical protein